GRIDATPASVKAARPAGSRVVLPVGAVGRHQCREVVQPAQYVGQAPQLGHDDAERFADLGIGDARVVEQELHVAQRCGEGIVRVVAHSADRLQGLRPPCVVHWTLHVWAGGCPPARLTARSGGKGLSIRAGRNRCEVYEAPMPPIKDARKLRNLLRGGRVWRATAPAGAAWAADADPRRRRRRTAGRTSPLVSSPIVHSTKEVILVQYEYLAQPDTGKRSPYRRIAAAPRFNCPHRRVPSTASRQVAEAPYGAAGDPRRRFFCMCQRWLSPWRRTRGCGTGRVWPVRNRRHIFRLLRDAANANTNEGANSMSVVSSEMAHAPL